MKTTNKKIIILKEPPIILTKDVRFLEDIKEEVFQKGKIFLLPEDAILIQSPTEDEQ